MHKDPIKICYLPGREADYVRTRVITRGIEQSNLKLYNCASQKKSNLRYLFSFFKFLKMKGQCDIILIGFMGQFLVPLVRLFTRKKIIFEAFLSAYQTLAFDRKSIKPKGLVASIVRYFEKLSCQLSDMVLLDTDEHVQYFIDQYNVPKEKITKLILGADDQIMYPSEKEEDKPFLVHFHGEFQALHGVKFIIEAASIIPDVPFQMIGGGRDFEQCKKMVSDLKIKNIRFIPSVPLSKIPTYINKATICLGIFGETQKTKLVIPFKVYEQVAMRKVNITADTAAIRELFTHEKDIYLCKSADPKSLADAILHLKNNEELRLKIARGGYETFLKTATPKIIGERIETLVQSIL